MDLDQGQAEALRALARASTTRVAARLVAGDEMGRLREAGQATLPFGEFDGAPVRYAEHWWRSGPQGWEALDDAVGATLDSDLVRWQAAVATIGEDR